MNDDPRYAQVMQYQAARGREQLVQQLCIFTSLTTEQIVAALEMAGTESESNRAAIMSIAAPGQEQLAGYLADAGVDVRHAASVLHAAIPKTPTTTTGSTSGTQQTEDPKAWSEKTAPGVYESRQRDVAQRRGEA